MGGTISIYGHDVIPEGFEKIGDEQIVVSTSFGVFDANKVYLSLDLAAKLPRRSTTSAIGREILPLYPDKAPARGWAGRRASSVMPSSRSSDGACAIGPRRPYIYALP